MLVLGIDTATWTATVGLARDDVVVAEVVEPTTRSHGDVLPRLLRRALSEASVSWDDVEGLAVSVGPGSFTGLRIGVSVVKGIAFASGVPVAAVPTLEALAWAAEPAEGDVVWAVLDARMREVYAASFQRTAGGLERRTDDVAVAPDVLAPRISPSALLVGDAVTAYPALAALGARVRPFTTHHPRGGIVARLGAGRIRAGDAADVGALEPAYIRPSQAELARRS